MKATVLGLSLAAVLAAVVGLSLALSPNAGGGGGASAGAGRKSGGAGQCPVGEWLRRRAGGGEVGRGGGRRVLPHRLGEYGNLPGGGGGKRAGMAGCVRLSGCGQPGADGPDAFRSGAGRAVRLHHGQRGAAFWQCGRLVAVDLPDHDGGGGDILPDECGDAAGHARGRQRRADANAGAGGRDYDTDDDGLIEITSLAQLDVIRHDLDGDGVSTHADHAAMFPNAARGMGCRHYECAGYELDAGLDFDTNGNGVADEGDAYWDDGAGWLPIGDPETQFRYNAVFDGNGHTISNLFIRWTDANQIGMFRATGADADIRNVRLAGVEVYGQNSVGGLVGSNGGSISGSSAAGRVSGVGRIGGLVGYNSGSVSGSHSSVPVAGSGDRVGGLVGSSAGSVSDSYATGAVTGEGSSVGGLVGVTGSDASVSDSYATGDVTGDGNWVGGLVGSSNGAITGSHATGNVTGESHNVGGLAGSSGGAITASYATGDVTGNDSVGGLVGGEYNGGSITASYATGSVTGNSDVGGLVGKMWSNSAYVVASITASYSTGSTTGSSAVGGLVGGTYHSYSGYSHRHIISASYATGSVTGSSYAGGLVGSGVVRVTSSYWDTQTTGRSGSAGGTGKTTRELQTPTGHTGIYAEWNADWWDFGTSRQYPALKYQGMDVGAQRR